MVIGETTCGREEDTNWPGTILENSERSVVFINA
jgi:hypothetical protein